MSRRSALLAVLSGLLLFGSFPPLDLGFLGWIALVPLLIAIADQPPHRALRLGFLAGAVAFVGIVSWMRVFGVLPWILLAAYLSLYPAVFAGLTRWIAAGRGPAVGLWSAALLWTVLEYLRSISAFGFPWALLGLTQYRYPALIQLAKIGGVFGVSGVLALAAASLASLWTSRRPAAVMVPALAIVLAVGWGLVGLPGVEEGTMRVAAVQPNVPARLKFDPLYAPEHMTALRGLVETAGARGVELIVMPETAIPFNLFGPTGVLREVGMWAHNARATLIASSLENGVSNIAVSIAPSGEPLQRYDKVRLVAFGEYGIRPGRRHEPLATPDGLLGVAICFESIFPDVGRTLVQSGASLLAVITNDGWFDGTSGGAQHAAHSVLRAVETGRWVIRAANTGLTMLIDPAGRVRDRLSPLTSGVLVGRASLVRAPTFYAAHGDVLAQIMLLAWLVLAVPRLRPALASEIKIPAFRLASAVVALPLLALWLLLGSRSAGLWPAVLLAFVVILASLRPISAWGISIRGFAASLALGTVAVGVLWGSLAVAFRAYHLPVGVPVPEGGWVVGMLRQLVASLAVEGWLRGITFAAAAEWKGWPVAVAIATVPGVLLQRGLTPEAMAWAMVTGVLLGLIRARTRNVTGLVIPHALGNILFSMVTIVR